MALCSLKSSLRAFRGVILVPEGVVEAIAELKLLLREVAAKNSDVSARGSPSPALLDREGRRNQLFKTPLTRPKHALNKNAFQTALQTL